MENHKSKILIVEDEGMVALVMRWNLERLGYEVCDAVSTGEGAIASVAQHRPDLILMDVHLPGRISGIEAARQISEGYTIPFIFFTGYSSEEVAQHTGTVEAAACLTKPVEMQELAAAVKSALENGGG